MGFFFSTFLSYFAVPSKPPGNVTAHNTSSNSLFIQWTELEESAKNGILLGYVIIYVDPIGSSQEKKVLGGETVQHILTRLSTWTKYTINVTAYTKVGTGPKSPAVSVSTDQGSKCMGH